MSWPNAFRCISIAPLMALAFCCALVLSGCTLTPVHSDAGPLGDRQIALRYAEPENRLEQVFFRALSARMAPSRDVTAPVLEVSVSASSSRIGLADISSPVTDHQVMARARYRVLADDDTVLLEGERTATGGYRATGQLVANDAARIDAQEDAVRAVAESVRLALIAAFAQ